MRINTKQYQHYLQSAEWQARRPRRLALAGGQCEFRPWIEIDIKHDHFGERCSCTERLEVIDNISGGIHG